MWPVCPFYGSTGYWVQGVIVYEVTSGYPGGPGSTGDLGFWVQIYNCSGGLVWNNTQLLTYTDVPWSLVSAPQWNINAQWYIAYEMSNGLISEVCEEVEIPIAYETYDTFSQCVSIPSQYTNHWYRSNVNWGGSPGGGSVTFYPGGSGEFQFCSNVPLYQGPLAANAAENSTAMYTQMYNQGTTCNMHQDFQT